MALLIAFLGLSKGLLGGAAATLIQAVTVITLLATSYLVFLALPNPIAIRETLPLQSAGGGRYQN